MICATRSDHPIARPQNKTAASAKKARAAAEEKIMFVSGAGPALY